MKKVTKESTKKLGEFCSFKEARQGVRDYLKESYKSVMAIYLEKDGTYSVNNPNSTNSNFICFVDKAGRRMKIIRDKGLYYYVPTKKTQYDIRYRKY